MQIINKNINATIIATAVALLQAAIPDLTPTSLIAAIKSFDVDKATPKDQELPKVYSIAETAEMLKISRQSVYALISGKKLKRVYVPAPRVTAESLEQLIQDGS